MTGLDIARATLELLDQEIARVQARRAPPLEVDKAWYCYVADANGSIVLDQDYPFVCEKIGVTIWGAELAAPGYTGYFRVRIEDLSNRQPLTLGQQSTVAGGQVMAEAPSVPGMAFAPLMSWYSAETVVVLPVATEFPRGGALRAVFEPAPVDRAWLTINLLGYKRLR